MQKLLLFPITQCRLQDGLENMMRVIGMSSPELAEAMNIFNIIARNIESQLDTFVGMDNRNICIQFSKC